MGEIPSASLGDSIRFNKSIVVPTALQGALLRRPEWVNRIGIFSRGSLSSEFGDDLRRKYGKGVYIKFVKDDVLLLFDQDEIRKVLDGSPRVYGHTETKKEKMGHFQPEAVTISPDATYPERRKFNEAVLSSGKPHPAAAGIHAVVRQVSKAKLGTATLVDWELISEIFETITLRLIFGNPGEREKRVRDLLVELMTEANGTSVPERGPNYDEFRKLLEAACRDATDESLAGMARNAQPAIDSAVVPDQVTHWLFAMNDTLAENAARAAGLISGIPEVSKRLTDEIAAANLDEPAAALPYLKGCIQEAMRLWPTTNFIMRTAKQESTLCGASVPAGTTILMVNEINHLDPATAHGSGPVTRFEPERWAHGAGPYHHFGGGGQGCPGQDLALLIASGVLATMHDLGPYKTKEPELEGLDEMPESYNPFEVELRRG